VNAGKLDKKWIELLDHSRQVRHNDQYDLSFFSTKEEAAKAQESARLFLSSMQELLKLISTDFSA